MWSYHEYDDDTFMDYEVDLDRSELPKPLKRLLGKDNRATKTSRRGGRMIPWYTSGFE